MSRRRTSLKRFALSFAVGAVLAGAVVSAVPAASFDDSHPCPADFQLLVCPGGVVDAPYSLQLTGKGGCDLYWWQIVNGALPSGLTMSSSGLISGTPTVAGRAQFWVIIHDLLPEQGGHPWCAGDNQSEREFAIVVDPGLVVTTDSAPAGVPGSPYSLTLAAAMKSGPDTTTPPTSPVTWSLTEGQLPPGLGLGASDGVISGAPTTEGSYAFVVRAALPNGQSTLKSLTIEVKAALVLTPPTEIPRSEVGVRVQIALGATGGTPPYTWTLSAGSLPVGVALTAAGAIVGRPTVAGVFLFTASVADAGGQSQSYSGVLDVAPRLAIGIRPLRAGRVGRAYRAKLLATGGIAPRTWIVVRGPLPRGLRLDRQLGVLSGVPRKAGRYKVRLQVVDALGVRSTRTYLVRIAALPKKPSAKKR